jgi:hypothetical protein
VNNSNLTEDTDIDNELNSSDIVITHVGESKDSHNVITREGETVVRPRWCGDRISVFKDSLDELLISLGAVNPKNTNIVTVNKIVNDCNNIIKSAADKAGMFVYINPQKKCSNKHNSGSKRYFNSDCYMKRKAHRKSKKYYYRVRSNENYCDMVCRSKEYKKTIQKQFNEFQKSFVNKLRGLRTSDPKAN